MLFNLLSLPPTPNFLSGFLSENKKALETCHALHVSAYLYFVYYYTSKVVYAVFAFSFYYFALFLAGQETQSKCCFHKQVMTLVFSMYYLDLALSVLIRRW